MQYTNNIAVFRRFVETYVPRTAEDDPPIYIYVQDTSQSVDFYLISYSSVCDTFLAVTDLLPSESGLDIEDVPLSCLENHHLFIHVYRMNHRPKLSEI